jgi:peroxiredoxin/thiol-disulfide isomerase/thioredoxin
MRKRCGGDTRDAIRASVGNAWTSIAGQGARRALMLLWRALVCCAALVLALVPCIYAGASAAQEAQDVLAGYKGKVLVLLLGMPDCPGTRAATEFLNGYVKEKPEGVEILRLDVATPEGKLSDPEPGIAIPRQVDTGRRVAQKLEFFYYPTLYLIDRDGVVRFAAGCDPEKVTGMVKELVAEKPGAEKKMFTPPLLPVGKPMPAFAGKTLTGEEKKLADLKGTRAMLLLFGATSCPFSNQALEALPPILKDYGPKGVALAVVTRSPVTEETKKLHDQKAPGVTVLADPEDKIGMELCHVPAVPFFFVLDAAGNVSARQPFTDAGARAALDVALGLKPPQPASATSGAG